MNCNMFDDIILTTTIKQSIAHAIGCQIYQSRKTQGLSGEELAKKIGISQQQISRYERGDSRISADTLLCLLVKLNIPADQFFHDVFLNLKDTLPELNDVDTGIDLP